MRTGHDYSQITRMEGGIAKFFGILKTHSANGGQDSKGMIMLGLKRWVKRK